MGCLLITHYFSNTKNGYAFENFQMDNTVIKQITSYSWRSCLLNCKTQLGDKCRSDHQLPITEIYIRLKKTRKGPIPVKYNFKPIPEVCKIEIRIRFKNLDLMTENLKNYGKKLND